MFAISGFTSTCPWLGVVLTPAPYVRLPIRDRMKKRSDSPIVEVNNRDQLNWRMLVPSHDLSE